MPRIRSIKPEFWTSGQIIECSTNARLLFIGLWNFCDDEGRHSYRPKQIKAEVFPADDVSSDDILRMLDELSTNELITLYEHDSERFLQVNGWHHQKIDRPQPAKHPGPFDEHSTIVRGSFALDRIGKDRKGKEEKPYVPPGGGTGDEYTQEFEELWESRPRREGQDNKSKAFKAYKARLREGHTHEEMLTAVKAYRQELLAEGKEGTKYVKLTATFLGPDKHFRDGFSAKGSPPSNMPASAGWAL